MVAYLCLETTLTKGEPSTYFICAILLWVLFAVRPCINKLNQFDQFVYALIQRYMSNIKESHQNPLRNAAI